MSLSIATNIFSEVGKILPFSRLDMETPIVSFVDLICDARYNSYFADLMDLFSLLALCLICFTSHIVGQFLNKIVIEY